MDLELGRFHGDWNANEKDADHGNGSVALPVFGPAIWTSRHAPHLRPEISAMAMIPVVRSPHAFSSPFPLFSRSGINRKARRRRWCSRIQRTAEVSETDFEGDVILRLELGPDTCLRKPFDPYKVRSPRPTMKRNFHKFSLFSSL